MIGNSSPHGHDHFHGHGHAPAALKAAMTLCSERGAQMTPLRRLALETLWDAAQPLGAYDLMPKLEAALGRKLTPSTIYRALEFLVGQGFVSRIESQNAFVPCAHPEKPHACVFFVCDLCRGSVEVDNPALEGIVEHEAEQLGFRVAHSVIELRGTCADCRSHEGAPS
jgi:Fur family transcriptional regulator, zinc uptake regulator